MDTPAPHGPLKVVVERQKALEWRTAASGDTSLASRSTASHSIRNPPVKANSDEEFGSWDVCGEEHDIFLWIDECAHKK